MHFTEDLWVTHFWKGGRWLGEEHDGGHFYFCERGPSTRLDRPFWRIRITPARNSKNRTGREEQQVTLPTRAPSSTARALESFHVWTAAVLLLFPKQPTLSSRSFFLFTRPRPQKGQPAEVRGGFGFARLTERQGPAKVGRLSHRIVDPLRRRGGDLVEVIFRSAAAANRDFRITRTDRRTRRGTQKNFFANFDSFLDDRKRRGGAAGWQQASWGQQERQRATLDGQG